MKKLFLLIVIIYFNVFNTYGVDSRGELAELYNRGQLDKAILLCKQGIEQAKTKVVFYLNLALLYEEKGDLARAISCLREARIKSNNKEIIFHLARLYLYSGRNKESIYYFRKYLKSYPDDRMAYFYLGLSYEDLNIREYAIKYYQLSEYKDPYFILPLLRLAHIYFEDNNLFMAIKYARKIEDIEPSIKEAYKILALASFRTRDYLSSFKEAEKFLNLVPGDKEIEEIQLSSRKLVGSSYFEREREKLEKARKERSMKVSSFVEDTNIPTVRIQIEDNASSFQFKATHDLTIYTRNFPEFVLKKDTVYKLVLAKSEGKLVLIDEDGRIITKYLTAPIFIRSRVRNSLVGIFGLTYAEGTYWSKVLDSFFRGNLEINIFGGKLSIVNVLNLEEYLYGVVPSEVSSSWPEDALRAQAVVARTKAFKDLGMHRSRGFDFCNTVHCQVYLGASSEKESTNAAVDDTRGVILTYKNKPSDIFYSSNCGGHTRGNAQFVSVKDTDEDINFDFPLTPLELYRWVTGEPSVFCKLTSQEKSRFRWQRMYTSEDLNNIIAGDYLMKDIYRIFATVRNDSGHIEELRVDNAYGQRIIDSEYEIRKVFDDLRSSLFRPEVKLTRFGEPEYFIFWGGGFGHALGLCQYGSRGMANKGYSYKDILKHYFPETDLRKAY